MERGLEQRNAIRASVLNNMVHGLIEMEGKPSESPQYKHGHDVVMQSRAQARELWGVGGDGIVMTIAQRIIKERKNERKR